MIKEVKLLTYIYGVRIYTAVVAILLIPLLIKRIGVEAYGLLGFFTVLQACLSILDAGVGGVLTREAIISKQNIKRFEKFNILYRKIILIFIGIAISLILLGGLFSYKFSTSWLKTNIKDSTLIICTTLMFCIFALRYLQGPFRSLLLSNESQITITTINLINTTLSQPFTLVLLYVFKGDVIFYFIMQLLSAALTCGLMILFSERVRKNILKTIDKQQVTDDDTSEISISKFFSFALQLSMLTILWVVVNQSDKLTLTRFLPLSEYAMYSIAISIMGILAIISDPLNQYLQPRLTKYFHEKNTLQYSRLYFHAFKFIIIITIPLSIFLFFFSEKILFIWSNNTHLATEVSKYLPWLFLGGVFSIYSNLIFLLLYSQGQLKKHTVVYVIFSTIIIPSNIFIAKNFHGDGTSFFYAVNAILLFILWGGYNLTETFKHGLGIIIFYIIPLVIIELIYYYYISKFEAFSGSRLLSFAYLSLLGFGSVLISMCYIFGMHKILPSFDFKMSKK